MTPKNYLEPDKEYFLNALRAFERRAEKEEVYSNTMKRLPQCWGDASQMAAAIGDVIRKENPYWLDFSEVRLADFIAVYLPLIEEFEMRDIVTISAKDDIVIEFLFFGMMRAQRRWSDDAFSGLGTAAALHVLCPAFFPLWNTRTALVLRSCWGIKSYAPSTYCAFCHTMADMVIHVQDFLPLADSKTVLKRIHEYAAAVAYGWNRSTD